MPKVGKKKFAYTKKGRKVYDPGGFRRGTKII